jgi:hypothetical protein
MAALMAELSTSTTPSTRSRHRRKVSAPTCGERSAARASQGPVSPAGRVAVRSWVAGRAGGRPHKKARRLGGAAAEAGRTAAGRGREGSGKSRALQPPTSLTATPSANASTLLSVTRRPSARDCAIALAPARQPGGGGAGTGGRSRLAAGGGGGSPRMQMQGLQACSASTLEGTFAAARPAFL